MKKRIVIIGNGFASLFFIGYFLSLPIFPVFAFFLRRITSRYDITLIGNGRFIYFPAIPEFIIGKKTKAGITLDIRPWLWRRNIRFVDDQVVDVQDGGRTVVTTQGRYSNDALFIGTGPAFRVDDIPGTGTHTFSPCAGPDDMDAFMHKLEGLQEGIIYVGFKLNKRDGFVAGRGGQMYECACLLDYALKKKGLRDKFEIHLFSPDIEPGETGAITDRLQERGIILDYGYEPAAFVEGGMRDADGAFRKADLVLFTPGIKAPAWVQQSCLPVSVGGHIEVDKFGRVKGLDKVFAAGDCSNHENPPPWVPHQAHMAQLRSQAAAKNMRAVLKGGQPSHTYRFELSCILNMENDAMWLHAASDDKPPFWNLFPRHSRKLVRVKDMFERLYLFYLRYL
ncbi:MAG TPA: NAD(P)/FAD-dependent oxidoreductase [Gammaproteobacteria bacterium]|nr:NAD(P)/FAD-dependent oxidoreductase [Gammaproteobacteria bacterium]